MAESEYLKKYITSPNGFARTAFGDLNVGETKAQIAWNFQYNVNERFINSTYSTSASVSSSASQAVLQTSTATTGFAQISTITPLRHVPGIPAVVRFTGVFDTPKANSKQEIGIGDTLDSLCFGYHSTLFGICHKNNGVQTWVYSSEWNNQNLANITPQYGNVYQIKFQWLGYGQIDFFVENKKTGTYEVVHSISYADQNVYPSLTSPSLPLFARVENTGNNSNLTLKTASAMAGLEAGLTNGGLEVVNGISNSTSISANVEKQILTIKNTTDFFGKNNRQRIRVDQLSVSSDGTKSTRIKLYIDTALSTSITYSSPSSNTTPMQTGIGSTSVSGGYGIGDYFLGKVNAREIDLHDTYIYPGQTLTVTALSIANSDVDVGVHCHTIF